MKILKFFLKHFFNHEVPLTNFARLVILKLLKRTLAKNQIPESYLYEFDAATVRKTVDFMNKKQNAVDAFWLQRGLIQENHNFTDKLKLAHGSSTVLRSNRGKNYLTNNDLNSLEKIDPAKAQIIKKTHQQLENIYQKATLNRGLIYQPQELAQIGKILNQALNLNPNLTFHRGSINRSLKLYFRKIGQNFENLGKTGIFVFDEDIDLLIKGEEFIFNLKIARAIEKQIGGKFYLLNPYSKKYHQPKINTIFNTGVYDLPHLGHASKIKNLKNLLNEKGKLIIAITNDKNANTLKNKQIVFSARDRKIILESLKYADKILIEPEQSHILKSFYSQN